MSNEKSVIVNNKKTGLIGFESETLMPGANKISVDTAKKMKAHPVIKAMIEDGLLEFPESVSDESGVTKLSPSDAVALVESTVDEELLKSWQKSDKRKPVLDAVKKQLEKLAAPVQLRSGATPENK